VLEVSKHIPENQIPGFLRFEQGADNQKNYPEIHAHFSLGPGFGKTQWGICIAHFTCEHSACFLLTQKQLRSAIASGGFMVPPHRGKYDLACTASTDPYTQCGFEKRICISHVDDFLIHHLPNKYLGTRFGVDEFEFRRQIESLLKIANNGHRPSELFLTETSLRDGEYSKDYYEPVREDVIAAIPSKASNVLSVDVVRVKQS
jgi:hypothetical protein